MGTERVLDAGAKAAVGTSEDSDLRLSDPTVSRYHLELWAVDDGVHVRDLRSSNGTWIGAVRVAECVVPAGTELRVGDSVVCVDDGGAGERSNNLVAITIALLAAFVAVTSIKGSNVAQAMEAANAERNNSWAWYQAVRVREDMATYQLANLERMARGERDAVAAERLAGEIREQIAEVGRVRARKDEVQARAQGAEAEHARDAVAPDVRVQDADLLALGVQRRGEVDGQRGLAHAALAGADADDVRDLRERALGQSGVAAQLLLEALLLLAGQDVEADVDRRDAVQRLDGVRDAGEGDHEALRGRDQSSLYGLSGHLDDLYWKLETGESRQL